MELKDILNTEAFKNYTNQIYSINNEGYPFLTYLGINFTNNEILNFKFYFSFFKKLSVEELSKVLPISDFSDFNSLYNLWNSSKTYNSLHQGATFAIKILPNYAPTYYFHLRLNTTVYNKPKLLNLETSNCIKNVGFCKEYTTNGYSNKNYFYFEDKDIIRNLANQYGLNNSKFNPDSIDELEYIESNNRNKIDLITFDQDFVEEFLKQKTSKKNQDLFKNICSIYNFKMYSPGIDSSGNNFSIYFIDANCINSFTPFDGIKELINKKHYKE